MNSDDDILHTFRRLSKANSRLVARAPSTPQGFAIRELVARGRLVRTAVGAALVRQDLDDLYQRMPHRDQRRWIRRMNVVRAALLRLELVLTDAAGPMWESPINVRNLS